MPDLAKAELFQKYARKAKTVAKSRYWLERATVALGLNPRTAAKAKRIQAVRARQMAKAIAGAMEKGKDDGERETGND